MGLFRKIQEKAYQRIIFSRTAASQDIAMEPRANALSNSSFWACVVNLARIYAHLPLHAFVKRDGAPRELGDDRLLSILLKQPCPYMTAYQWKFIMGMNFELHGEAVAIIMRDTRTHLPTGMVPVNPGSVVGFWKDNELWYRINGNDYSYDDVLIIHNTPTSFESVLSPIYYATDDLDLEHQCKLIQRDYYNGSSVVGRKIGVPQSFTQEQRDELKSIFNSATGFKNLVLDNRVTVDDIQMPAGDMNNIINAQKWTKSEVATRFNVPPFLIGETTATYANAEQQGIQMVVYCLQPRIKSWEDSLLKICDEGQYIRFSLAGLMRGDHAARASYYQTMIMNGSMSINEVRALEELPPIKNGDVHFFPMNYAAIYDIVSGKFAPKNEPSVWDIPVPDEKKEKKAPMIDEKRRRDLLFVEKAKAPAKSSRKKLEALIRKQMKQEIEKIKQLVATDQPADLIVDEFKQWMELNAKEILPQYKAIFVDILQRMIPVVKKELDTDIEITQDRIDGYSETYADGLIRRHCGNLAKRVSMNIDSNDFDSTCDSFIEDIPIEEAEEEVNRSSNAFSVFLYQSYGLQYMHIVADSDSCPFCSKLDGRVVSVSGYVLKKDSDEDDGDGGVRHIRKNYRHPPFHSHCECHVAPGR